MIKRTGFTLAEVLVTLLIIGVVAALTIPTLLGATNDNQLKTAYKKAFSSLANAMDLIKANETKCKISTSADLAKCFQTAMKGTIKNDDTLVTSDGMAYKFYYSGAANKKSLADACDATISEHKCRIIVDLNGLQKDSGSFDTSNAPNANMLKGKDQQAMLIMGDRISAFPSTWNGQELNNNMGYEWAGISKEDAAQSVMGSGYRPPTSETQSLLPSYSSPPYYSPSPSYYSPSPSNYSPSPSNYSPSPSY